MPDDDGIAPEGTHLYKLGEPIPPEDCDVVVVVATAVQDDGASALVVPGGLRPQPKVSVCVHTILARIPLLEWQTQHLRNLKEFLPN
jgi:hypothetical protein